MAESEPSKRRKTVTSDTDLLDSTPEAVSDDFFEQLKQHGVQVSESQVDKISRKISEVLTYIPKVGVLGKTGVGKSSLCNALFGADIAEISNVAACTRDPQELFVSLSESSGIVLVDVPGVGESEARDKEYEALYKSIIPKLDVVLWVVKADDRAFAVEERFYRDVVKPNLGRTPFIAVVNQVDKVEPFREWDEEKRKPGPRQAENIKAKLNLVAETFGIAIGKTVSVSAAEKYRLVELLYRIVLALPNEKKISVVREAKKENRSEEVIGVATKGFWEVVKETAKHVFIQAAPVIIEAVGKALVKGLRKIFKF